MTLLDTNIVIAYFKGEPGISEKVLSRIEDVALSGAVFAELWIDGEGIIRCPLLKS